jgi:peroxiredoxin
MLTGGDTAPDFLLPGADGDEMRRYALVDLVERGPVVVTFYQFDFHPSCTEQLCALRTFEWPESVPDGTAVAISTDSAFSHRAFAREHNLNFPLLSDDTGTVSDTYGVLLEDVTAHGFAANRAVFVVDTDWTVRYAWAADNPDELPDWRPVTEALEGL